MTTILIVDDETLVRRGLESMIPWDALNCQLIGQAQNGEEGLEKIKQFHPDIVFTDIKMPKMDGLSMISQAITLENHPIFIILSGYNDFELVRSAMRLGAIDYLVKLNLDESELISLIREAQKQLQKQHMPESSSTTSSDFKKTLILELLRHTNDQLSSHLPESFEEKACYYQIIALQPEQLSGHFPSSEFSSNFLFNLCKEQFPESTVLYALPLKDDVFFLYVEHEETPSRAILTAQVQKILSGVHRYLNQTLRIGVSTPHKNLMELHEAYQESFSALTAAGNMLPSIRFYADLNYPAFASLDSDDDMVEIYRHKVKLAKEYIHQNRFQKISLNEVASALEITPGYLSRIFKKVAQKSFSDYVAEQKIEEAKLLLLKDNNRIYEVSDMLGYEDPYYFSKVFKKVTHMTPSEYIGRN